MREAALSLCYSSGVEEAAHLLNSVCQIPAFPVRWCLACLAPTLRDMQTAASCWGGLHAVMEALWYSAV